MKLISWLFGNKKEEDITSKLKTPYQVSHQLQWHICSETSWGTHGYEINNEILNTDKLCLAVSPFKIRITEMTLSGKIEYNVSVCYSNDNSNNNWPIGHISKYFSAEKDEYLSNTLHQAIVPFISNFTKLDTIAVETALDNIKNAVKSNDFESIISSCENAFMMFNRNILPEKYLYAFNDNYNSKKLNADVIDAASECIYDAGIYYAPNSMITSDYTIEEISNNIKLTLDRMLSKRQINGLTESYVIYNEEE